MKQQQTKSTHPTNQTFFQTKAGLLIGAVICCFLWGSAFPGIKLGYQYLAIESKDTFGQILFAGIRFTMAGILAVLFGSVLSKKKLIPENGRCLRQIGILSIFQTILQYGFFYVGLAHTTGVKSSIVNSLSTFIVILIACVLLKTEPLTKQKTIGSLIGFLGIVAVNVIGRKSELEGFHLLGDGLILLSSTSYAFSTVFLKQYAKEEDPVLLSGYQFILGGFIMSFVGFLFGGRLQLTVMGIGVLVWLALVSAIAYSLWGILLKNHPASHVSVCGFMTPIFGVLLSAILLGEYRALNFGCIIALVLVTIGIWIVNARKESS